MKQLFREHAISFSLLLVLTVMVLIFCFSAQDADQSSKTSGFIVHWLLGVFCRDYDDFDPQKQQAIREAVSHFVRKTAHFTEYSLLGFSLLLHFEAMGSRFRIRFPRLYSQLIGSVYAISDELHQKMVSGRSAQASDVLLDAIGVFFGLMILWLIQQLCQKRRS